MTRKETNSGQAADLRKQAEKMASETAERSLENIDTQSPAEIRQTLHELRVHQIELGMHNEELRRSQAELEDMRALYFDLYDMAPVGYVTVSEKGVILETNLTAANLLGVAKKSLILQPLTMFIIKEDQDIYYRHCKMLVETDALQSWELRMVKKNSTVFWAHLEATTAQDAKGAALCRIVLSDVTELKQNDEALRKAHWRLEGIIEGTHLGTWEWNVQTGETVFNDVWAKVTGYTLAELAPISIKTWETLCHPDDLKQSAELLERHFAGELPYYEVECRMKHKDGYWVWVHDRGRVMTRTAEGKPLIMLGTHSDITLRKRLEEVQIFLAKTSSGAKGEPFFEVLARYLAQNLGMDYVCIDRLEGDELTARTVAVWCDGHFEDNVTYALKDTPCGDVVGKTVCFFPASVCQLFPRDPALQELKAESYVGVTLFDHNGRSIGLIAVIGRSVLSLEKRQTIEATLKLVAIRAAGEMERLDAVEALRKSEEQLRDAHRLAHIGVWSWIADTDTVTWTEELYHIAGLDPMMPAPTYAEHIKIYAPESWDRLKVAVEKTLETGASYQLELELIRPDGATRSVNAFGGAIYDNNGRVAGLHGTTQDITARKQAEQALQLSNERLVDAQKIARIGNWEADLSTDELYWSQVIFDIFGFDSKSFKPSVTAFHKAVHPDDKDIVLESEKRSEQTGLHDVVHRIIRPDGEVRFVHELAKRYTDDNGNLFKLRGTVQDITERKQAEEALRESETLFRKLFEDHAAVKLIIDPIAGTMIDANEAAAQYYGWSRERLKEMKITEINQLSLEEIKNEMEMARDKKRTYFEFRHRIADGSIRDVAVFSSSFENKGKVLLHSIIHDITARKQMEQEILRSQKLESLGVLAGGIAHDFNNLMTVVMGYIELVIMDLPPGHVSRQRLQAAIRGVDQTRELTSRLITFSQGGGPLKEMADVTKILRDAVRKNVKDAAVEVKFDFREDIWQAEVDDLQITQCFYNLTRNAVEAMPEGGNLTISVENALISTGEVLEMEEGSYLKITFADEGIGIPENFLSKIFDPYFTTKKMGAQHGLGLGLAVCYSVVKQHGGHITAQSSSGKGAAFVLYLPVRADMAITKEVKEPSATGTVRVLIMDDEPQIREIERIYLERWGYEVTEAQDGQEAIDAYKKAFDAGNPFDLVMLDLTVRQGMGGQMAMTHLLKINPAIKAIVASGYVADPVMEYYSNYGFLGAMKKPFQRAEMKFLVEKILNPKGENSNENISR